MLLAAAPAWAQAGDVAGEDQPPLPADLVVPPAPVLAPEAALESFRLQPGFAIELAAAEPLVVDPVALAWDFDGRMWVVEMRGFMPTADGEGELDPVGQIAVLSDTDGDGRMDERSTFLDGLVLPRGVLPTRGGALVIAPPDLLFCRDTDGDGRADERHVVDTGFDGPELHNPEHAINGLMPTLDNWIRCANHRVRYRWRDGKWERQRTDGGGQWGITKDDLGRAFFNTNSDPLRCDRFPSHYMVRNPDHGRAAGANLRVVDDFSVWPVRVTTGVNRGYKDGLLKDGKLTVVTAACGPVIYRGGGLGRGLRGDALVCEPAANLVKRYDLFAEADGAVTGTPTHAGSEFLASTDERFRPVNLYDGPDGALYVVDLYRGILQHRVYMTTFLRKQVDGRGLAEPIGLGRIWRVVPEDGLKVEPRPALADASWTEVVALLSDESGWWRDTAQRVLVEEGAESSDAIELTRDAARDAPSALGRMHAVWALEGMAALDEGLLLQLLSDPDERVVTAAVRVSEPHIARPGERLVASLIERAREGSPRLRRQVLLSLGEGANERCDAGLAALLSEEAQTAEMRSAALSGLFGRELEFTARLVASPAWDRAAPGRAELFELLARCVTRAARSDRIEALLDLATQASPWQQEALLAGLLAGRPKGPDGKPSWIRVTREPVALATLARIEVQDTLALARSVSDVLAWPGKPGVEEFTVRPLDASERSRFARGRELYDAVCSACHLSSGTGEEGKAPRLRGSEWVLGPKERAARILLHGLDGPLEIDGRTWNLEMPAYSAPDEDIAAVLTYVRREWGHGVDPVAPEEVAAVRTATRERGRPWTVEELNEDEDED